MLGLQVIIEPPSITVREGEMARFVCSARSDVEIEAIEWTMERARLPDRNDLFLLTVNFTDRCGIIQDIVALSSGRIVGGGALTPSPVNLLEKCQHGN